MVTTLSVALCTWNGARYLPELLDSLISQSVTPDEIVVGDDGSQDQTLAIVARFAARSAVPMHVHRNATRLGATANFSATIGRCRGQLVALADQDDIWWPDKLERLSAAMEAGAVLAFSDAAVIDDAGAPLGYHLWTAARVDADSLDAIATGLGFDVLLDQRIVTGCCSMIAARARPWMLPIPDLMPPRTRRPLPHDAWLAIVASALGPVAVVREPLMDYRRHAGQSIGLPPVSTPSRAAPDWDDPAVARAQVAWIEQVLGLLSERGAPLAMPGVDDARRRASHLAAGGTENGESSVRRSAR